MTIKIDNHSPWADGDLLLSADLNDTFKNSGWVRILTHSTSGGLGYDDVTTVCGYAGSRLSVHMAGSIYSTLDNGATWVAKNTALESVNVLSRNCKADRNFGFFVETDGDNECAVTNDGGYVFFTKTSATFGTSIADCSYPATDLIVLGGNDGGGAGSNHIIYSTNNGSTWTDPVTPPVTQIYQVDMFNGSYGAAIDSIGSFWVTTDGAANWSKWGVAKIGGDPEHELYMTGSQVAIRMSNKSVTGVNFAGSFVTPIWFAPYGLTGTKGCHAYESANGNIYFLGTSQTDQQAPVLLKTPDAGSTWWSRNLTALATQQAKKGIITEMADNQLVVLLGNQGATQANIYQFDDA